jgi:hypothetical protein
MNITNHQIGDAAEEGRWFTCDTLDLQPGEKAPEVLLASIQKRSYRKALQAFQDLPPRRRKKILFEDKLRELIATHLLLDWKHIERDGKPIEPTTENKIEILKICPPFADWVVDTVQEEEAFRVEGEAEDAAALKSDSGMEPEMGE